jgi:predicted GH43/DUF377 family glycosyl hydrolase
MKNMKLSYVLTIAIICFFNSCVQQNKKDNRVVDNNSMSENYAKLNWEIDPTPVLTRSEGKKYDSRVVGDPCIVWDNDISNWRMFYFAGGYDERGISRVGTGMAISKSPEDIGPGDWEKINPVQIKNEDALLNRLGWHKWWIVMDAKKNNSAAIINNKYWAVFTVTVPNMSESGSNKHIQVASAKKLEGPWTVSPKPILSPDEEWFDGRHCDTPTAYWFEDKEEVIIFYKAYPKYSQKEQPDSPFGSGTVIASWHPDNDSAKKLKIIQRPGQMEAWNQGWMSTPQIFFDKKENLWYGLINGSPTAPADDSHREPAPSLGGWVKCSEGSWIDGDWAPDTLNSPFAYPNDLTKEELKAGMGVNFWRHHLLVTPNGQKRIYFNSGNYGTEQMYSLISE